MGDRVATIDMHRKLERGLCLLFGEGELGILTQCRLVRGLPPYQVAS